MVLSVRVPKSFGEEYRQELWNLGLIDPHYEISSEGDYLYLPLKEEIQDEDIEFIEESIQQNREKEEKIQILDKKLSKKTKEPKSLKDALYGKIPDEKISSTPSSFDIIGDIAIIDIPEDLTYEKMVIGKALKKVHKNVETVLRPTSNVVGEFRTRNYEVIAGKEDTKTVHREHGCVYRIDVSKAFFSPRLSTERKIVSNQVREGEVVFDMFAGVGPFSILIAKERDVDTIYAVDKNPYAVEMLKENIKLNNVEDIVNPIHGDIREVAPSYSNKADRAIMNLPFKSGDFLYEAFELVSGGGIIHYYDIREEEDLFKGAERHIREIAYEKNRDFKIISKRVVRSYSPGVWNIAIDLRIE